MFLQIWRYVNGRISLLMFEILYTFERLLILKLRERVREGLGKGRSPKGHL